MSSDFQDPPPKKTAIVIGAGPAGLTAAYELCRRTNDWRIIILEESSEIGGLSRTVVCGECRIDIGGHRFFSKSKQVNDIWMHLMPIQGKPAKDDIILNRDCRVSPDGPDPEKEDAVMLRRHRVSRIFYLRHFFDYPLSIRPATFQAMGLVRTVKAGCSYLYSALCKRKERSLEDFSINRFGKTLYSMFFEDYTEKIWGVHPSRISPEWGAQRIKGLSLWKAFLNVFIPHGKSNETSLIEEFLYPKSGPGQIWEQLAARIQEEGVELRLNARVTGIRTDQGNVSAVVLSDGTQIPCEALFSSMAVKDLVAAFDAVPADVFRIASELPYRDFIMVGLFVDKLAIRNTTRIKTICDIVPDTWIYVQERDVRIGRIQIYNNWSPYMVDDVTKHVWIGLEYFCTEGDEFWTMDDSQFVEMAIKELHQIGFLDQNEPIHRSIRIKVKKAYPAYFGSYGEFGTVRKWLNGFSNLYCIGRNGQHRYNNMDHSMMCGIEAVRALLGETDRTSVWTVNTDNEYHETE